MKEIIEQIKKKHPYIDKTALEIFEHYIKEYDRELDLIIEVENRKVVDWFVEWLTDNYKEFDDMELWERALANEFFNKEYKWKKD